MRFDRSSTIGEIYASPLGRDVVDRLLMQIGRSPRWVDNPAVRRVRLGWIEKAAGKWVGDGFIDTVIDLLNTGPAPRPDHNRPVEWPWWKEAVFYQIYPRSFADADGDGLGDLRGIISRLDYLADLGVDCLWLSPIFDSPGEDNGYDVRNYRDVLAEMGTLADLDALIAGCHSRGMRIILDLVVNHSSAEHPWFQQAMADPSSPEADYYHVVPGTPEAPPNNWTSFFSGPAWRWVPEMDAWVLRLFAHGQIDLNWENPALRAEVADIVRWWTDRGVDGFRLDVINYISKRPGLPDGNELIGQLMGFTGVEHYFHGPRLHEYLAEPRRDGFGDALMVGETPGIGIELGRAFTAPERGELDLIFSFDALETPGHTRWSDYRYDLNALKHYLIDANARLDADEWMSVFHENHDNPRMISKVNPDPAHRTAIGKALAAMLLLVRGTPFIYQGQEIGAINQAFTSIDDLRDVESLHLWAEKGDWAEIMAGSRDHARTPMRWTPEAGHGFTTGTPWIDWHEGSVGFTVAEQQADPDSVWHFYRTLIALRRAHPALTRGTMRVLAHDRRDYFGWFREHDGERWLIEINLSEHPIDRPFTEYHVDVVVGGERTPTMRPYEVVIGRA